MYKYILNNTKSKVADKIKAQNIQALTQHGGAILKDYSLLIYNVIFYHFQFLK